MGGLSSCRVGGGGSGGGFCRQMENQEIANELFLFCRSEPSFSVVYPSFSLPNLARQIKTTRDLDESGAGPQNDSSSIIANWTEPISSPSVGSIYRRRERFRATVEWVFRGGRMGTVE